jgi:hypothetical protein
MDGKSACLMLREVFTCAICISVPSYRDYIPLPKTRLSKFTSTVKGSKLMYDSYVERFKVNFNV